MPGSYGITGTKRSKLLFWELFGWDHGTCPFHSHQGAVRFAYTYTAWHLPDKYYLEDLLNIVQSHLFTVFIANTMSKEGKIQNQRNKNLQDIVSHIILVIVWNSTFKGLIRLTCSIPLSTVNAIVTRMHFIITIICSGRGRGESWLNCLLFSSWYIAQYRSGCSTC